MIIWKSFGFEENLIKGFELLKHWITSKTNDEVYESTLELIFRKPEMLLKDKSRIMTALSHYAKFGENSRFRDVIPEEN